MKRLSTAALLALFGLAPAIGAACEYDAAKSASASPPAQLSAAPAATKVPASRVSKALAPQAVKPGVDKTQVPLSGDRLAATTRN